MKKARKLSALYISRLWLSLLNTWICFDLSYPSEAQAASMILLMEGEPPTLELILLQPPSGFLPGFSCTLLRPFSHQFLWTSMFLATKSSPVILFLQCILNVDQKVAFWCPKHLLPHFLYYLRDLWKTLNKTSCLSAITFYLALFHECQIYLVID